MIQRGHAASNDPGPDARHRPRIAALIASRNRPDLVRDAVANLEQTCAGRGVDYELDIIVVECGTAPDKRCEHSTISYVDEPFNGKCVGHNMAYRYAAARGAYDFYWVLHNDVRFDGKLDPAATLIATLEAEPRMAICSPLNVDGGYPQGFAENGRDWHAVCVCDYLGFMIKRRAVDEAGFLDPVYKYCWGASHELAYHLYRRGWFVAYSDRLTMKHLGGSTYGQKGTATISRDDYVTHASKFMHDHLRERFGENWDERFWAAACAVPETGGIEFNAYAYHRAYVARAFNDDELADRQGRLTDAYKRCGVEPATPARPIVRAPYAERAERAGRADRADRAEHDAAIDIDTIAERAAGLHPWFYPVKLDEIDIPAGVGTDWSATKLANRIACRQSLIVGAVAERYDLRGKRVLELASNCGYWSARYAEHGAAYVLGIEGRQHFVDQANLYWQTNRFLDGGRWRFERGDLTDDATWSTVKQQGKFDITVCAGLLYHLADYRAVVRRAAELTDDALVIDTRVTGDDEAIVAEPGDLTFNALPDRLDKVTPNLSRLIEFVEQLGFEVEQLQPSFGAVPGLQNVDDYSAGRRVTLLAMRPHVRRQHDEPTPAGVRLHLGCGPERRDGWVNVDANADVNPDVVSRAEHLPDFADASVDAIEACHLFEHFTQTEALGALREWARVLKPGGKLCLELPNLDACISMLGKHTDPHGHDLGMVGLFGYPPAIDAEGLFQCHKWAWSPGSLEQALREVGFDRVDVEPVTQTWRHAAKVGRDMRIVATRAGGGPATHQAEIRKSTGPVESHA